MVLGMQLTHQLGIETKCDKINQSVRTYLEYDSGLLLEIQHCLFIYPGIARGVLVRGINKTKVTHWVHRLDAVSTP